MFGQQIIQQQKGVKRQGTTSDFHSVKIQELRRLNIKYEKTKLSKLCI